MMNLTYEQWKDLRASLRWEEVMEEKDEIGGDVFRVIIYKTDTGLYVREEILPNAVAIRTMGHRENFEQALARA